MGGVKEREEGELPSDKPVTLEGPVRSAGAVGVGDALASTDGVDEGVGIKSVPEVSDDSTDEVDAPTVEASVPLVLVPVVATGVGI